MKNIMEKTMENKLYTYLQLPDNYWTITTTMDYDFEYVMVNNEEDESN